MVIDNAGRNWNFLTLLLLPIIIPAGLLESAKHQKVSGTAVLHDHGQIIAPWLTTNRTEPVVVSGHFMWLVSQTKWTGREGPSILYPTANTVIFEPSDIAGNPRRAVWDGKTSSRELPTTRTKTLFVVGMPLDSTNVSMQQFCEHFRHA